MPYVEGEIAAGPADREKTLPVEEAVRMTREVADALAYAHAPRRDPSRHQAGEHPAAVGGHALVADFGIARAVTRRRQPSG